MDFLDIVHTRRSIRKFTDEPVSSEDVDILLHAAMSSPTATNSQSWRFVVIDDKDLLREIPHIHPYAGPAADAPLAILVCGDVEAGHAPECWPQDGAAAIQTMLAHRPQPGTRQRMERHPSLCRPRRRLHQAVRPSRHGTPFGTGHSGASGPAFNRADRYDAAKVHHNHW